MNNTVLIAYWSALKDILTRAHNSSKGPYSGPFPLPDFIKTRNGGAECDMAAGPCSCRAWHYFGEERR